MKTFPVWLALVLLSLLSACGGGGGDPGAVSGGSGGTPVVTTPTIVVSTVNAAGTASTAVSSSAPLTVKATVKDAAGKLVPNALVSFTSDNSLVSFLPSTGTSLTDASGVASVTLRPVSLSVSGAGTVTAAVSVGTAAISGSANYLVGVTALELGSLSLAPNSIAAYGSTEVSVDVLTGGAKYTGQQLNVNFSSSCVAAGKATLAATTPTNNGTAKVVYRDQGCGNNDVITASLDGVVKTSGATLTIAQPAAASVQFSSAEPVSQSIVIKGQGGLGRTETATLKFKVFDIFNAPLPGQKVKFTVAAGTDVAINKTEDSTDANGEVIMTVNSGSTPTTFRIRATLATLDSKGVAISTLSDSIVVTTGSPVQRAFSLSVVSPNVEGWSYDSGTTTPATNVNILLADSANNPVSDGTPVVFQTNLGAIGSSSKGACNTTNGGCSVDFRTQQPRVATPGSPSTPCNASSSDSTRVGLATVCASTTDGLNTLFAKIGIFFSGSSANNVFWIDGPTPSARLTGNPTDLGTVGATDSKVFTLLISDVNLNPMPSGSKVEILGITNATATGVTPAIVQNVFPVGVNGDISGANVSGIQGSLHTVSIASTQPKPCLGRVVSTFNVAVTTPRALVTTYPFTLAFSCP